MIWLLLSGLALAGAPEVHGSVSSFLFASWAEQHALIAPSGPSGMGAASGRLAAQWTPNPALKLTAHPVLWVASGTTPGLQPGTATPAPEAVDLSWRPREPGELDVLARVDWLHLRAQTSGLRLTLGRQPIGFGTGVFFTPMDLVSPFGLTTIDSSHRPGVDAARIDAFFGTSGRVTTLAAYAGSWDLDGSILLSEGQLTIGQTDLHLLLAEVHSEHVLGGGLASAVGPVGVHADVTLTQPQDDDVFVRAVGGLDWRPGAQTTLSAEAYLQTLGADAPQDYLQLAISDRFKRGELQQLGQVYLGGALQQELSPLLHASLGGFANLSDGSTLLSPGLRCSVADNADLHLGGFIGLGKPPLITPAPAPALPGSQAIVLRSEFGSLAPTGFLQMMASF